MKPGKKLVLTIAILWTLMPTMAIPEGINAIINQSNGSVINSRFFAASPKLGRIYYRVRKNGKDHQTGMAFATALSQKKLWKELTAIAEVESNFDETAIGKDNDIGAYQVRPDEWGYVPISIPGQTEQADEILRELIDSNKGNKRKAIRSYNGSLRNPKTMGYSNRVFLVMRQI